MYRVPGISLAEFSSGILDSGTLVFISASWLRKVTVHNEYAMVYILLRMCKLTTEHNRTRMYLFTSKDLLPPRDILVLSIHTVIVTNKNIETQI